MDISRKKPIIGILGSICSGKSTVAAEFAKLGCAVIDADKIAHQFLNEPAVREKLIEIFGENILSGTLIDRRKLGIIVFGDARKLNMLDELIHPLVLERTEQLIERYSRQKKVKAIVLDMPLLLEVGWAKNCDRLIFVDCNKQFRQQRAKKTGLFDENGVKIRENFQFSLDTKAKMADNVIDNNSEISALVKQVAEIFSDITEK